ncbi:translocation protein SEC62-like isoform X2 [Babylonia areolata]|uniref:translocation protein SEC62-like isoform X2 n=1 Tax=Babylonia areolata TaxID=304850 RepID=UPI003FD1D4B3
MADSKNRREVEEDGKPTKEECAVAKFLRFNVPVKEAKLHGMKVQCFFASPAIDALLESKWSSKNATEPLFVNRSSCVSYCHRLLEKGLFHRAEWVQRKKDQDKGDRSKKKKVKDISEKEDGGTGDEERKNKREKQEQEAEPDKTTEGEETTKERKTEEKKEEKKDEQKKKKEKPVKLVMTDDQRFLDGEENVYVWIYDPPSARTLFIGFLIVFGVTALCLFPLWPESVRIGVYYFSLSGAGFVGFILSLAVLRLILFCVIWMLTLGRNHFWLLPNLTEDVSFLESFRPLYKHDVVVREERKSKAKSSQKSKGKAKKKSKSSDTESDPEFEMVGRADLEEELGDRMEGDEDESEENGEMGEEEEGEYGAEDEEEDYEEDEDENDGLEEEEGYEEQEDEEEDDGKDAELKKDK